MPTHVKPAEGKSYESTMEPPGEGDEPWADSIRDQRRHAL